MKRAALLYLLLTTLSTGCYSQLTGNQARLTFAYPAVADFENFNRPIAPGARLALHLRMPGDERELHVVSATSSRPDVIAIDSTHEKGVILRGGHVGRAQITVTIQTLRGTAVTDTVDMYVRTPNRMELGHSCTDDLFAVYPANAEIELPLGLAHFKQNSIGYGYWPIKISPKSSLTIDEAHTDQGSIKFRTGKGRHRVAIRSRIDDTILGLALAEPAEVDGVTFPGQTLPPTFVDRAMVLQLQPTVAGVAYCGPVRTRARTLTPDICDVSAKVAPDGPDENMHSLVRVVGRAYGACRFVVEYPESDDGGFQSKELTVPVGKIPHVVSDQAVSKSESPAEQPWWLAPLLALLAPLALLPLAVAMRRRE